jgi:alpha-ketoglutarate-dependent taurine dioxygenase
MDSGLAVRLDKLSPRQRAVLLRRLRQERGAEDGGRIPVVPRTGNRFPLSFSQQSLWFLDQLDPGNPTYSVPVAVRVARRLDAAILRRSLEAVAGRHETLRTTFEIDDAGQPVQVIAPAAAFHVEETDLAGLAGPDREAEVRRRAREHGSLPFDLAHGPLLRASLLHTGPAESVLLLTLHHIVADGWSAGILMSELLAFYRVFAGGEAVALPPLPVQYADYAVWQRAYLDSPGPAEQLRYWTRTLTGAPPVLNLFRDRPRPATERHVGGNLPVRLPGALTASLQALARAQDCTLFMVLLAGFATLLHRRTGEHDIVIGTPVAGRRLPELEGLIGFFVNSLPLRLDLAGAPAVVELLGRVRTVTLGAYANQDIPFEKLVEALQPARSLAHAPLFQVMFTFLNEPTRRLLHASGEEWTLLELDRGLANRDLTLRMEEAGGELAGHIEYNADLFSADGVQELARLYTEILGEFVAPVRPKPSLRRRARPIDVAAGDWVERVEPSDGSLPVIFQPRLDDVDLATWARDHREVLAGVLRERGGLLFRGFAIRSTAAFEACAAATGNGLVEYEEYSTPRHVVQGKVYTSTEYPPDQEIMLHNEMSYAHRWPMKIWFYCARAAAQGGATPVGDSRQVYRVLDPAIREEFERKGVMYVRNYGEKVDLPWQQVFQTSERARVEEYCRAAGISFHWKDGDRLRTSQVRPAALRHPQTGELVWFNAAHMFHVTALDPATCASLRALFGEDDLPRHAFYGDGTAIDAAVIAEIRRVYRACAVTRPWREGEILMLDNMLAAHGREAFVGPREVLVAMAEPWQAA